MGVRYYIWCERRLVRVSLKHDGLAVAGNDERPTLLVRRGLELQEVPGAEASRALRALANGAPDLIHNGPPLQKRRHRYHSVAVNTEAIKEAREEGCKAEVIVTDGVTAPSPRKTLKELIIPADVVAMCRRWATSDSAAAHLPPNENSFLCRMQPIVQVQRSAEIDTRLRMKHQHKFAELLGLAPASTSTPSPPLPKERRRSRSTTERFTSTPSPQPKEQRRSVFRSFREFSPLEDSAIVQWVCRCKVERRVNGNLIWRDLQPEYPGLTGTARSWHSLRNRYLRHILPALPRLGVSPDVARRLRSAAAMGELKRKPKGERRNSLLEAHLPKTGAGAWSKLPRPRLTPPASEPKRPGPRENQSPTRRSPRYSAVTRAHAARHASPASSGGRAPPTPEPRPPTPAHPAGTRRLYNPRV